MPANDLYELTQICELDGDKMVNRFHLQDDGGGGSTPEVDIIAGWMGDGIVKWVAAISSDVVITGLTCRRVYPTAGPTFESGLTLPGDLAGDTSPPQSVAVIQLFTSLYNRRGRGRTHVSGVPEDAVKDGLITNAQGALLAAIGGSLMTGFGAFSFVVADPVLGSFAQINDINVQTHMYTLRSRRFAN